MSGVYHGRASVTVGYPNPLTWHLGQIVYLEGLRVRVSRITNRPLDDEDLETWPDADPDDRMMDVEFVEAPL